MSKRQYANPNLLDTLTMTNRIRTIDPIGIGTAMNDTATLPNGQKVVNYALTECNLTDDQMNTILAPVMTTIETNTVARSSGSKTSAHNIPSWATWDQPTAQTWWSTNIDTPITNGINNLPATLTLATARSAILQMLQVMSLMSTMLWALARMVIALRNATWPDLPDL